MKTTKKTQLEKKVAKLLEEKVIRKNSILYEWIELFLRGVTKKFNTCYVKGRGWKNSNLVDKTLEFCTVLSRLSLEYEKENEAPRGGRTGMHVTITTKLKP